MEWAGLVPPPGPRDFLDSPASLTCTAFPYALAIRADLLWDVGGPQCLINRAQLQSALNSTIMVEVATGAPPPT